MKNYVLLFLCIGLLASCRTIVNTPAVVPSPAPKMTEINSFDDVSSSAPLKVNLKFGQKG